jgi:hypothetical protein
VLVEVTDRVSRMETVEEAIGISLEALYATYAYRDAGNNLKVNFDVVSTNGTALDSDVRVVAAAYNEAGQLLATDDTAIWAHDFAGLDSNSLTIDCAAIPTKVLLYVKTR